MKGNMDSSFIASRSGIDVKRRDERRRNQVEHTNVFENTQNGYGYIHSSWGLRLNAFIYRRASCPGP